MLLVAAGDVVFTILNVERYGLAGEINPFSRFMIGAGGSLIILWIATDIGSTALLYTPLISLFLMLPIQTREGKASTAISSILTARVTVSLFNVAIYYYSFLQAITGLLIVGIVLMFLLRYVMRNGDYLSWNTAKSALHGFGVSLSSHVVGFLSTISHLFGFRRQKATESSPSSTSMRRVNLKGTANRPSPFVVKRDKWRIAVFAVLVVLLPFAILVLMDIMIAVSGIENLPPSERGLLGPHSNLGGWVFLAGFAIAIVGVVALAVFLMKLVDAVKGKTVLVQLRGLRKL
jgi:hypothetical protein